MDSLHYWIVCVGSGRHGVTRCYLRISAEASSLRCVTASGLPDILTLEERMSASVGSLGARVVRVFVIYNRRAYVKSMKREINCPVHFASDCMTRIVMLCEWVHLGRPVTHRCRFDRGNYEKVAW